MFMLPIQGEYDRCDTPVCMFNDHIFILMKLCFSERLLENESHSLSKYRARFDGLMPGTSYDIHIATELDGKTVVQTKRTIKTLQSDSDGDKKSVKSH